MIKADHFAALSSRGAVSGVEVDLLDSMRFRMQGWQNAGPATLLSVDTVWFLPPLEQRAPEKAIHLIEQRASLDLPTRLVIDQPRGRHGDSHEAQVNLAIKLRRQVPESVRIAIGIRPHQIANTRAHLAQLSTLRMQASEWDLDLAVDLGREIDWLWEAEAALYRIMGSLALVRLSYPTSTFDGRFRASLTQRAVLTCAELGYGGDFSLVVPLPWWHWRNTRSLEAASLDAVSRISREFGIDLAQFGSELQSPRLADMA
jgi:hypothetical protein